MISSWLGVVLLGGLVGLDATSYPQVMISRPIVAATLTGALFGRPAEGLLLGLILEAFSLINLPIGAARYPESGTAAVAATSAVLTVAPVGLEPGHLVLAVALALGWERVAAETVVANRRFNGRLLANRDGTPTASLERQHLAAMSVDFGRGAAVSAGGGLLGVALLTAIGPAWGIPDATTLMLLGVVTAGVVGTAIPLFGGVRVHPVAVAGGIGLALVAGWLLP